MPFLLASNKVGVSYIEAHTDVEAQASWPPPGYAPQPQGSRNSIINVFFYCVTAQNVFSISNMSF